MTRASGQINTLRQQTRNRKGKKAKNARAQKRAEIDQRTIQRKEKKGKEDTETRRRDGNDSSRLIANQIKQSEQRLGVLSRSHARGRPAMLMAIREKVVKMDSMTLRWRA
jgi:imidazolonepropionase-like amidohydrolase